LTTDLTLEDVGQQSGTSKTNIQSWVKAAAGSQALKKKSKPSPAATSDNRTAREKLRLLLEASKLAEAERGEFLRKEGLRDGDLERFEAEALGGLSGQVHSPVDQRRIQELERVNAKQEKRLREAEVLLDLQKSDDNAVVESLFRHLKWLSRKWERLTVVTRNPERTVRPAAAINAA
jgi:hypothetical protein